MNRFYDEFDGYNNRKHRESLSKKNKYQDEEDLDDLDIIADDISEKFMGSYGIHAIIKSSKLKKDNQHLEKYFKN